MRWAIENYDQILNLAGNHLLISVPAIFISLIIAVPLGWWSHRNPVIKRFALSMSSTLYALPSLALFVVLPLIIGTKILDPANVIVAMVVYGVALLLRTSVDAFESVPQETLSAATAVGHARLQRLMLVELPLAGPTILAGLRVVSASTLSLVSVGALIGVPSLGHLFTDGFARNFPGEILVGIIATIILAALLDGLLVIGGYLFMPWTRKAAA